MSFLRGIAMTDQRDPLAEKALDAVKQRYSPPPPDNVQGEDFRELSKPFKEGDWVIEEQVERELNRICYPPSPSEAQAFRIGLWRVALKECMMQLAHLCPKTEERAIAISRLRECMMWGEAAIRCNPDIDEEAEKTTEHSES